MIEAADGIGAAAHTGENGIRKPAFLLQNLGTDLFRDHRLEVPDDGGEGVGSHDGAQTIVGIFDAAGPFPHGFGNGVFQGAGSGGYRNDVRPQQFHFVDVKSLPLRILDAHENHAFHVHQCSGSGGGNTVLSGAGFGDQTGLSHLLGQQCLAKDVVDLVGTGVVQVFPFQIDLRTAQIPGHFLCVVQPARAARIIIQQVLQFPAKIRIILEMFIGFFQFDHCIHQCLRNVLAAVTAESSSGS